MVQATFGPHGRTAVTAGEDNRVIVWDVRRGAVAETLDGHAGQTTSLAISRDGRTLYDRRARRQGSDLGPWRRSRPRPPVLDRPARASAFSQFPFISSALSADGRVVAAGHDDGTVSLIDVRTLRTISTFDAVPSGPVRGMGYIPHSRAARHRRR